MKNKMNIVTHSFKFNNRLKILKLILQKIRAAEHKFGIV